MNKETLIRYIVNQAGITQEKARLVIEIIIKEITETLQTEEELTMRGLGKFYLIEKGERTGRNPQTGMSINIPARRYVHFKQSSSCDCLPPH